MLQDVTEEMRVRRITLSDGRYLIFYEFDPTEADTSSLKNQREADESLTAKEKASV